MKLTIDRTDLAAGLKRVLPAVPKHHHLAVLNGVRIDATAGVDLTCTDLDVTITHCTDATVTTPGSVVAPARLLERIVGTLAGDTVTLELADGQLQIESGKANASLKVLDLDAWPQITDVDGEPTKLDATLVSRIQRVRYAASTDTAHPTRCAVAFIDGHVVALDAYRMAWAESGLDEDLTALVPADTIAAVLAATNGDDAVEMTLTNDRIAWAAGPTVVTARTTPGDYVRWQGAIPGGTHAPASTAEATVAVGPLVDALTRTNAIAEERSITHLRFETDRIDLTRKVKDVGTITDTIAAQLTTGEPSTVPVNHGWFMQALRTVDGDEVTFRFADQSKPMMFVDGDVNHLIMPVRIT